MKNHPYRITVEQLADPQDNKPKQEPMRFDVSSHDDIFVIVDKLQRREEFTETSAQAFGVGLKLFGSVILENKGTPLFASLMPHFMQMMRELKKGM